MRVRPRAMAEEDAASVLSSRRKDVQRPQQGFIPQLVEVAE